MVSRAGADAAPATTSATSWTPGSDFSTDDSAGRLAWQNALQPRLPNGYRCCRSLPSLQGNCCCLQFLSVTPICFAAGPGFLAAIGNV